MIGLQTHITSKCEDLTDTNSTKKVTTTLHRPVNYLKSYYGAPYAKEMHPGHILSDSHYNKATAFTEEERENLLLRGLLPPAVESMETQIKRAYKQLMRFTVPLSQHIYLSSLRERNITLFYRLVVDHLTEIMPLIYTPVVGEACLEYGLQFRSCEGMYITIKDLGNVRSVLMNWKANVLDDVAIIVVTDGSRILGLGDLGACGMGIPVGKLALYVAAAGFHPATTLPILLDVGTNNEKLLNDEFYLGLRQKRVKDSEYYQIVDEFMQAVNERWPHAVIQFEDFSNDHCFNLLDKYRNEYLCFNDDIQGTGAVIAAGFLNAIKVADVHPSNCRILFLGAGSAAIGVAKQILLVLNQKYGIPTEQCVNMFYVMDSKGLITADRNEPIQDFKKLFIRQDIKHADVVGKSLSEIIQLIEPAALIGLCGQPGQFSTDVLKTMAKINKRPIVFPLSNPTSKAECTFEAAFCASEGKVVFASGSPFDRIEKNGISYQPSQGNNLYTFPGLGLGAWLSRAKSISEHMVTVAALTLAESTQDEHREKGMLYPPLNDVRNVSVQIAASVMQAAFNEGLSRLDQQPSDYVKFVKENQYHPNYLTDFVKSPQKA